jgi:hypothetical protein
VTRQRKRGGAEDSDEDSERAFVAPLMPAVAPLMPTPALLPQWAASVRSALRVLPFLETWVCYFVATISIIFPAKVLRAPATQSASNSM